MEPVIHEPINLPSIKYMDSSDDEDVVLKRPTIKTRFLDSDEEISENISGVANEENTGDVEERTYEKLITKRGNLKRILTELGSDSDENEGGSNDLTKVNDTSLLNDEKDDLSIELNRTSSVTAPAKVSSEYKGKSLFSQSDLYDAEDSDDDTHPASSAEHEDSPTTISEHTPEEKSKKKKPKEKKIPKAKSSKGELQKIHSESQRMLRESRVTLPYHRPRQRTLAEFLNRREHTVLPVKSLKTSPTKLGAVWKTLEKKVTEAEQFYKSDSGSDEEEQSNKQGDEQDKKQDDGRENELEKKGEAPAAMDSVIISEVADSVSDDPNKEVVAEVGKALLCEESSDEKFPRSITPSVCDLGEKVTDVPVEGIKDIDEAVFVSGEVSDVLSDSENAKLNEERGDHKEESDSKVNNVDSSHDTELACHTSSISNNICDIAVCENIQKSDGDHLHSQIEKPTLPTASNTDFSNLFLKTEIQKKDGALQVDDCGSETLTDRCEDGPSTGTEQLHMQVNAGCSKIKIPSPPPMEDSESISLRLDDDTVDETGPKQECGHVSTLQGSPTDAANPEPQTQDEADPPRVSTPVRMLMELEDANNRDSAEEAEAVLSGHHNTSPLPTAVLHPSVISPIRLKGDPDNVIDLDEDVRTNPRKEVGVRDLMQRFIRHHIPKKVVCEEKKVDIGIEIVEGGGERGPEKVKREVMSVTLGGGDPIKNASPGTERPGARLRSLREELQREIARKRDEEWAKRQREYSLDEEEGGEEGKCNLDDEEEEELTESSSSEEEEEEVEENDVDMSTKSRPRSEYVDDEAEESDEEEEEDLGAGDNEESLTEDKDIDQDEEDEALILENDSKNEEPVERREVSSDVKDSSGIDEVDGSKVDTPAASGKKSKFQRFKTFDLFDSEDDNDNVSDYNSASELLSPPVTPFAKDRNGSKGRLSLPSPALPLTALQRYTNSPVGGQSWDFTQKQLSDDDNDGDEESPKQTKDENDPLKGKSALINLVGQSQESVVAEDELLNLMSGAFLSRVEKMSDAEDDFSLALEDTQEVFDKLQTKKVKEEGMDDDKRGLKNFVNSSWSKLNFSFNDDNDKNDDNDEKEVALDDDMETIIKRKKLKRLDISDDEDDSQNAQGDEDKIPQGEEEDEGVDEEESEGESGGEEEGEESELDEEEDEAVKIVEYDSEENAIVVERKPVKKSRGARRGLEFLEAEAELSEGEEEWAGSGDEDEHGLDRMEKEEGDADKLDDEIVRRELGRIHMRQVLDEDKRDVRLLQEIFLEDGELHTDGQGRERRFRWKNVDNMDDGDLRPLDSGDEEKVEDEDENEEKWRRLRHEREMWLREHKENGKIEDSESLLNEFEEDSQLLKLGRAALRRTNSFPNNALTKWLKPAAESKDSESNNKNVEKEEPESPDVKRRFQMLCKRGSFLARKDGTLERLAEIAIRSGGGMESECLTSSSPVVAKTKNSRKFVFTMLSPEKKKDLKASVEAPKAVSLPVKKNTKRKRRDPKQADGAAKKSKLGKEASIFQFL